MSHVFTVLFCWLHCNLNMFFLINKHGNAWKRTAGTEMGFGFSPGNDQPRDHLLQIVQIGSGSIRTITYLLFVRMKIHLPAVQVFNGIYPLVICYIAIENGPVEIVDSPTKNGDFLQLYQFTRPGICNIFVCFQSNAVLVHSHRTHHTCTPGTQLKKKERFV